jgi:putative ABC transport system ATP-binding protein
MIQLEGIHRIFEVGDQHVHALNDVNLVIQQGEYVSVMGPSGSGKSTLLNVLGLLDSPDRGQYKIDGKDVTAYSEEELSILRRNKIGFVFQFFHLVPRLTAAENIELPMILAGMPPAERKQRVQQALEAVAIADRAEHRPDQLSGGQRQRVAIARATIMHPSILLADEPTGNLDQKSGAEVIEILESLNSDGITVVLVTHDRDLGARAHRKIRMLDGRISGDNQ